MIHARVLQVVGADAGGVDGLGDKTVDVGELSVAQLQINAPQDVDGVRHRLPVEGGIIVKFQVEILLQGSHRLLMPAFEVGLIDLVVGALLVDLQIRIPVHRYQGDLPGGFVDAADHLHVGQRALLQVSVPGIHTEDGDGPVTVVVHMAIDQESADQDGQDGENCGQTDHLLALSLFLESSGAADFPLLKFLLMAVDEIGISLSGLLSVLHPFQLVFILVTHKFSSILFQQFPVMFPVCVQAADRHIVGRSAALVDAENPAIFLPGQEHDHMGLVPGADDDIPGFKLAPGHR